MKKLSVIIPTLQKNIELLNNLVCTLDKDVSVSEIILIDNSRKGYNYGSDKLKVILPNENLFVNPSWNLGVNEAREDIVALFNDDITIPFDFCKKVVEKMTDNMGIVGFHRDYIENIQKNVSAPELAEFSLEEADGRCGYFGVVMFFNKSSYVQIPEDIKVFWGDDWLFVQNKRRHRKNYFIFGQKIYHYGSLSSADKSINPYARKDSKLYRKYTKRWWEYVFNIEPVFRGFRITVLGIELLHHYDKKH